MNKSQPQSFTELKFPVPILKDKSNILPCKEDFEMTVFKCQTAQQYFPQTNLAPNISSPSIKCVLPATAEIFSIGQKSFLLIRMHFHSCLSIKKKVLENTLCFVLLGVKKNKWDQGWAPAPPIHHMLPWCQVHQATPKPLIKMCLKSNICFTFQQFFLHMIHNLSYKPFCLTHRTEHQEIWLKLKSCH